LIAFAAMMAGSVFLQISQVAEALHVSVIRVAEKPGELDWGEILRAPFSDWLEWVFFAGSVAYAYALAASPHNGVATRIERHRLRWVGGGGHWRWLRPGARANAAGLRQAAKLERNSWIGSDGERAGRRLLQRTGYW
jgi:hypothetical protein